MTQLSYGFEARAVNAEGEGPWSETLWVESGASILPNTPQDVRLVGGSVGATSFDLSWVMPNDHIPQALQGGSNAMAGFHDNDRPLGRGARSAGERGPCP